MTAPITAARAPRAPHPKAKDPTAVQEQTLAVQRRAFDFQVEEDAELEREREAMEQLMLAQLKDEDEIVKKYIAMI